MLSSQFLSKLRRYLKVTLQKLKPIWNHVRINPSTSTCTHSQGLSHLQILIWMNPNIARKFLQEWCGNLVASGVQWRLDRLVSTPNRIWYYVKLLNHEYTGRWMKIMRKFCSGIIKKMNTKQNKFGVNVISICQLITT